jgi:glucan phosphoethanolaminetransferase (alkaline phosphatase superfamily)
MHHDRSRALAEFKRMILWIALAGVVMVAGALFYISRYEPLRLHMVVATVLGVFFSVLLGAGLLAAAFFSDKSGHDQNVTDATRGKEEAPPDV